MTYLLVYLSSIANTWYYTYLYAEPVLYLGRLVLASVTRVGYKRYRNSKLSVCVFKCPDRLYCSRKRIGTVSHHAINVKQDSKISLKSTKNIQYSVFLNSNLDIEIGYGRFKPWKTFNSKS